MSEENEPKLSKTVLGEAWENADEIDLDDPKVKKAVTVLAREMEENKQESLIGRIKSKFSTNLPDALWKGFIFLAAVLGTIITVWSKQ